MVDPTPTEAVEPAWLKGEPPMGLRWATMARLAWRMALHDRQQTIATILGIAFAYILIGQNIASSGHYMSQSSAYIDRGEADLWIVPLGEKVFYFGASYISTSALHQARVTTGVDWASPVVRGMSTIKTPDGRPESVILVGVPGPELHGGPFNLVKGEASAILRPNAVILDDPEREKLGGINLGSTFEIGGHRAHAEGFSWGLVAFGSYVFVEYDFARSILEVDSDRCSLVMVKLDGTVPLLRVQEELKARIPDATVLTTAEYRGRAHDFILYDFGLLGLIGMGIFIGVTVGFAIVVLAMLSSVQQNLREFGTMKAIGATNGDLRRVVFFNALGCTAVGAFIGAACLCQLAWGSRSSKLNMIVQPWLLLGLVPVVTMVAMVAVLISVRRIARIEPASVFR